MPGALLPPFLLEISSGNGLLFMGDYLPWINPGSFLYRLTLPLGQPGGGRIRTSEHVHLLLLHACLHISLGITRRDWHFIIVVTAHRRLQFQADRHCTKLTDNPRVNPGVLFTA